MDFREKIEGALCPERVKPNAPLILLREPNTKNADCFWLANALGKQEKNNAEELYCTYLQKVVASMLDNVDLMGCYYMNLRPECGEGAASQYYNKIVLPALKEYCKDPSKGDMVRERMQIIKNYVSQGKIGAILTVPNIYEALRDENGSEVRKQEGSLNYRRSTTTVFGKELPLYRIYHPAYYRRNPKIAALLEKEWEPFI